jgi:lysophospholipase L1-like esterase
MDNRSSYGLPEGAPALGHGGKINAASELAVNRMHDSYVVEGSATINSLTSIPRGRPIFLRIENAPKFVNSTRLKCPDNRDLQCAAGDVLIAAPHGNAVWRVNRIESQRGIRASLGIGIREATPVVAKQHFGIMRGTGWNSTAPESGGVAAYMASVAAAVGDRTIVLNTTPTLYANQLIVFQSSDGQYYTAVIKSISTATLTLKQPLIASIPAGGLVSNFYSDEDHPNRYGYYAMVDDALRAAAKRLRLAYRWTTADRYIVVGSPTQMSDNSLSYSNPGSTTTPARKFVATAANDGFKTPLILLPGGNYTCRITLTANTEAGSADTALTYAFVTDETGVDIVAAGSSTSRSAEQLDIPIFVRNGKAIFVQLAAAAIGTGFSVSQIEIFAVADTLADIDFGKHVVIGDSYVAQGYINERIAARLPGATLVNKGVSGNTTSQMVARFAVDVASQSPDFVWIIAEGANDRASAGIAVNTYEANVAYMAAATTGAGADAIIIGAGVGSTNHSSSGNVLTLSRSYVLNTKLGAQAPGQLCKQNSFTAAPTTTAGRFTSASVTGFYATDDQSVFISGYLTIPTIGTASGRAKFSLPVPSVSGAYFGLSANVESTFAPIAASVNWDTQDVVSVSLSGAASGTVIHFNGRYAKG